MAYNSPVNLAGETWGMSDHVGGIDRARNVAPELFAIAIPDRIPAAYCELSVPAALRELFESDGLRVEIAFADGTNVISGFRSKSVSHSHVMNALVLPFSWEELVVRVASFLDRSRPKDTVTRFGDVYINFASMEVRRSSGEQIMLTAQEFKALRFFVSNPGRVISRDELLNRAWGYDNYPCSRTVDTHILKLRQKLEVEPSQPKHFLTIHSVGYKFLP